MTLGAMTERQDADYWEAHNCTIINSNSYSLAAQVLDVGGEPPVLPFIERMKKRGEELLGNAMENPNWKISCLDVIMGKMVISSLIPKSSKKVNIPRTGEGRKWEFRRFYGW